MSQLCSVYFLVCVLLFNCFHMYKTISMLGKMHLRWIALCGWQLVPSYRSLLLSRKVHISWNVGREGNPNSALSGYLMWVVWLYVYMFSSICFIIFFKWNIVLWIDQFWFYSSSEACYRLTNLSKLKLNIFNFYTLTYHIWLSYVFDNFLFAGWESTNMALQREGKTFKLEFSVQCSSWTEDCMRLSLSKYMLLALGPLLVTHYGWKRLIF